ncbi:inverse autotransporter beta domain-containing protein [Pseudomonas sp. NPDC086251]|uniref:inverse autotransporter beta domain-containing protein n=1 Tax=Pseudomonas sp. NPDC086251 TaxID=3364431 RepID=UPI003837AF79
MRVSDLNPFPLSGRPSATRVSHGERPADWARRQRLRSLTASVLLAFYGYELLAVPLAMAAQLERPPTSNTAVAPDAVYLLYIPQGEDLAAVARRFDVDASSLSRLRQQMVSAGWSEQVWLVPKAATGEAALYPGYVLHTLQPRESLAQLALRSNRSERELTRLNTQVLGTLAHLKPGGQVVLPAPLAPTAGTDSLADSEAQAFEQRLAQNVSQAAQSYGAAQDQGAGVGGVLAKQAAGQASGSLSQGAEDLLGRHGRAKVGVRINSETENVELEFDYLHPWLEDSQSILFSQLGGRRFDERYIGNLGLGYRQQLTPDLMLGSNVFLDQDFSRDHNRAGLGVEAWTNGARLAANAYVPLSDWKRSHEKHLNSDPERFDLYERAAKGWDARGEALIPGVPQLAATARYFQWYGEGVDVFGGGQLEKAPRGYGLGLRWQPIPLLGFTAEHQKIQHGDISWEVGLSLNWSFDRELAHQLNASDSSALRPLAQARQDFVQRDYNVVLDYKQKEKPMDTPFVFASNELVLQAPPLGAPAALTENSPALQGVRAGAVISYSLASSARSASAAVSIDADSGVITVPPGASTQSLTSTATQTLNGVVVGSAHYALQIQQTPDTNAPAAPTLTVTDSNQDNKPEAAGQTEASNTVRVTWPDASSSAVVADGTGHWTVEASATQLSGTVSAVAIDVFDNTGPAATAPWDLPGAAPVASAVSLSGSPIVGQVLTSSYSYSDADGDQEGASTIQWLRAGAPIAGATSNNYRLVSADMGNNVSVSITPVAQSGAPRAGLVVPSSVVSVVGDTDNYLQPDTAMRTWEEAGSYCQSLGGRLPSQAELEHLFIDATTADTANGSQYNEDMCSLHNWPLGNGRCGGGTQNYFTNAPPNFSNQNRVINMTTGTWSDNWTSSGYKAQVACTR